MRTPDDSGRVSDQPARPAASCVWDGGRRAAAGAARVLPDPRAIPPAAGRGAAFLGCTGAVLGGSVGTVQWPVIGTCAGTIIGLVAGMVTGVLDGLVIATTLGRVRSRWPARVGSALVALAAVIELTHAGYRMTGIPVVLAAALPVLGVLAAMAFGPLIGYGIAPATVRGVPIDLLAFRTLGQGVAVGGIIGGLVGGAIGLFVFLPTAPFAVVLGAGIGGANGGVLACLGVAVVLVPRMRARR